MLSRNVIRSESAVTLLCDCSPAKPWVRRERDDFAEAAARHGFDCTVQRYFGADGDDGDKNRDSSTAQTPLPPMLEMHFRVFDELRV